MATETRRPFAIRDLPVAPKVVIAAFLLCAGLGYFAGLVQLHFQHASPGNLLPTVDDAVRVYVGSTDRPISKMEKLIQVREGSFNGTGTMAPAFFEKSGGGFQKKLEKMEPAEREKVLKEREGERQAMLAWLCDGANKDAFNSNEFVLTEPITLTEDFVFKREDGRLAVNIKTLFEERCVRCHTEGGADSSAEKYPLDTFEKMAPYLEVKSADPMDLRKLAQTTHVHLLGFTLLFGLTGIIFSFTSYPTLLKVVIGPLALVAQVCDISCWWLARYDAAFAKAIMVTGAIVACSLAFQIGGSLLNLCCRPSGVSGGASNNGQAT